jgi:small subunit ribosomal protein S15
MTKTESKVESQVDSLRRHEKDTGSEEVQVAQITERIAHLTEHLKMHKKDHHTRRGLMLLVGKRRRLLRYIKDQNITLYRELLEQLQIRA